MKHLPTAALLIVTLSVMTSLAFAQNLEDVIYKKDGSVLRGTLVEQDFENGRYKIQLQGGSLFSVEKADIEKISKEAPLNGTANNNGININIDNSPTINQNPVVEQDAAVSPAFNQRTASQKASFDHVVYIGSMAKSWIIEDDFFGDSGETYTGLNLAYQRNFNKHIALYSALNTGSISTYTRYGTEYEVSANDPDVKFLSYELDALLSTNNYEGWQLYTGLGLFSERFSVGSNSNSFSGTNFIFGLGYSWESLQVQLRVAINNSSDYADNEINSLGNFQMGFNF
jgi:hypothetical protein